MIKILLILVLSMFSLSLVACVSKDKDSSSKVKVIDIQLTQEEYAFGVDKNNPELLAAVNELIADSMEDGTFEKYLIITLVMEQQ